MKVMVVGPTYEDSFADNVAHVLEEMGHDVLPGGPARDVRGPRKWRSGVHLVTDVVSRLDERVQNRLVENARWFRPDLVITLDIRLRPKTVEGLKSTGSAVALWFPDAVSNLRRHELFLSSYDRIYLKNPILVEQLSTIYGLPVAYMPEAANPTWHRPSVDYGSEPVIVVAGNIHPTRAVLLDKMADAGIPLTIYGPPIASWMKFPRLRKLHTGRSVVRDEKARVFRSARAVLNNLHPAENAGSNCRLFEATASGAVALTEWREGMDLLFEPDVEVLRFRSFGELVAHCERLLQDPAAGEPVADAAARRSHADHTYQVRLTAILADLDLA